MVPAGRELHSELLLLVWAVHLILKAHPSYPVEGALFAWSFHWSLVSIGFLKYLPPPSPRWQRGTRKTCCSQLPKCWGLLWQAWKIHKHTERIDQCTDEPCEGGWKLQFRLCCLWKLHESSGELLFSVHLCSTRCKSIWRSCSASRTRRFPSTALFRWIM